MPSQFKLPWYKSLVKGDVEWMDGAISTVQDKKKTKKQNKKIEKIKTKQGSHGFKREKKIMIVFGEKKEAAIVSDRRLAYANEANYFFKRSDILNSSL